MTREEKNRIWFDSLLKISTSEAIKNEMDLLPSKEELDKVYISSDGLNKRIKNIIIKSRMKQKLHFFGDVGKKIAILIIILFAVSSITLLSVEATRNAIFNAVIEHFDKYTEIRFDNKITDKININLYLPTYLPQGFKEISNVTYGSSIMLVYGDGEGNEIILEQRLAGTGTTLIDNENTNYQEIEMNGNVAYLFDALTTDDYNILIWHLEGMVFELYSLLNSEELIKIGESLKNY